MSARGHLPTGFWEDGRITANEREGDTTLPPRICREDGGKSNCLHQHKNPNLLLGRSPTFPLAELGEKGVGNHQNTNRHQDRANRIA